MKYQNTLSHSCTIFSTLVLLGFCSFASAEVLKDKTYKDSQTGMEFVWVEGGCFQMGDTFGDGSDNEKPAHEACVEGFNIGKTEVTQAQWEKIMISNPSNFKGASNPVEHVSWNDAQEFIRRLNNMTGQKYRLPTEAEWEYAARGGKKGKGYKYSGSGNIDKVAWYDSNSGRTTHPVAQKKANELGVYDMSGNVWEWVQDWYSRSYKGSQSTDPTGPSSGSYRVFRGGSWIDHAFDSRVACRSFYVPNYNYNINIGFRLAIDQ